jgi:hypothetical protein
VGRGVFLGDNCMIMDYRPGLAETEEFKTKYGYSEYQEQEKERRELEIFYVNAFWSRKRPRREEYIMLLEIQANMPRQGELKKKRKMEW